MFHLVKLIYVSLYVFSALQAVSLPDSLEKIPKTGYVLPTCDSLGIPLFIDGVNVGRSPLLSPIPVLAGFHEVGYAPPQITDAYVKNHLYHSIKKVYVPIGDTVRVALYFDQDYNQLKAIRTESNITQYIGLIMVTMTLILVWKVTG